MKLKHFTSIGTLVALILLGSCNGNGTVSNSTDNTDMTETTAAVTESNALAFLPEDIDYNGETVNIMQAQWVISEYDNEITYPLEEITPGDIVAEAVYQRTRAAEEKLNVHITATACDWGDGLVDALRNGVLADTHEFDAVCGRLQTFTRIITEGYLADLRSMETLNLDNPWWDAHVNQSLTIGGKQLLATGDINYYDDYAVLCMVFNKNQFNNLKLEIPYDKVRSGTWTFDAFYALIHDTVSDLNGDGQYDENDFYGFITDNQFLGASMIGFGQSLSIEETDGTRVINQSSVLIDRATYLIDILYDDNSFLNKDRKWEGTLAYELGDPMFGNGQALISSAMIASCLSLRGSMEDDFGILPSPKWDTSQENYYHTINWNWASAIAVPFNCIDFERTGYILDTMGALSPDTITAAVIDKNVTDKSVRDEDSAEMLELILHTKIIDPAFVFDWEIGSVWRGPLITAKEPNVASELAKVEKKSNIKIKRFMKAMDDLE